MYAGKIVETGDISPVYHQPAHPYTLGLMNSLARPDVKGEKLRPIVGSPPDLLHIPSGCSFHPRCPFAKEICITDTPALAEVAPGRKSACHFGEEVLRGQ